MLKILFVSILALLVASCGEDTGSGSTSSSASGSTSSSSNGSSSGSLISGEVFWVEQCQGCHDKGTAFSRDTQELLASYIEESMPLLDPSLCVGACATDIASYILSWNSLAVASCDSTPEPVERSLRLLTNTEYQNTINDLFDLSAVADITESFPGSVRIAGYDNNAKAETVNESRMGVYWGAAKTIASEAASANLSGLMGCSQHTSSCANTFLNNFGTKVFRRPLTTTENASYSDLFLDASSVTEGAQNVLKGMLISPHFLYRAEIGEAQDGNYHLTPYETATLLSYTFSGSTPDDQLLQAANNDSLSTRAQLVAQVERLLSASTATTSMAHFARQWLRVTGFEDVNKDQAFFPEFTSDVKSAMTTEFDKYLTSVLLGDETNYSNLYVSDYTFANRALADYYDLSGGASNFPQVDAGDNRGGILKLGAVLATLAKPNDTSPVLRGVFVRNKLLCQNMPLPPANLEISIPDVDPGLTTRERFSAHSDSPVCATCHQYIDTVGFGFDTFDGAGKFNPNADDTGSISGLTVISGDDTYPFTGVGELSDILAQADGGAACFVQQFQVYATGQVEQDPCSVKNTAEGWKQNQYSFQQLWNEIVSSDTYLIRQ